MRYLFPVLLVLYGTTHLVLARLADPGDAPVYYALGAVGFALASIGFAWASRG